MILLKCTSKSSFTQLYCKDFFFLNLNFNSSVGNFMVKSSLSMKANPTIPKRQLIYFYFLSITGYQTVDF